MDVERLVDGLWRWTTAGAGSVYYEAPDAVVLFDPLLPAGEEEKFLAYLDRDVERLSLPVSILLTTPANARSAPILRERYEASDRVPETVETYPAGDEQFAYFIRPHHALVVAAPGVSLPGLPVELSLPSELARS
jgi:hypothetical protein